jgi:hypothetical protein
MPDENGNGEIPFTGDPRVDAALVRIRGKFRDLEDAILVQVHLEKRMGDRIKKHAEAWDWHEAAIKRHNEWMEHFESKLNALTNILMKREGRPATNQ